MNTNLQTAFCQTCNARDRVIQHGRCVVCSNEPQQRPSTFGLGESDLAELSNLWHLSATAVSPSTSKYERKLWAAKHYSEAHPETTSTAAYKILDRSPWT